MTTRPFPYAVSMPSSFSFKTVVLACFVSFACFADVAMSETDAKNAEKAIIPPALKAVDTKGKEVELAKLKGKVVLVDFWATWCAPCLKQMPSLKKIHKAVHEKGFVILGVANNDQETLLEHFKGSAVPWSTIADSENVISEDFQVDSWPTALLINAKGEHVATNLHAAELLERVIKELDLDPSNYQTLHEELEREDPKKDSDEKK